MELLKNILLVGAGSFLGGAARYVVSTALRNVGKGFPWGTLVVNLAGCMLIGVLWGLFSRNSTESCSWSMFLMTGICGGFTTFSTFSKEALMMFQSGNYMGFALYVSLSIIAGISLVALGAYLSR